jgi:hypothetical protein
LVVVGNAGATGEVTRTGEEAGEEEEEEEEWAADKLDLADLRAQWKGPVGVHLDLHLECLETELQVCQQRMASHQRRTAERNEQLRSRKPAAAAPTGSPKGRWLALQVRIAGFEGDIACLRTDRWLDLSPAGRAGLLGAIEGRQPWALSLRTAWARLRQPPELIAHVAQRVGSRFAMVVAGSNMQLIASGAIRLVNAQRAAQGFPPAVACGDVYAIDVCIALLNVAMAFASGAVISFKIRQRAYLRTKIAVVGFRWEEVPRGFWALVKAMFAVPRVIVDRATVVRAAAKGTALAGELTLRIASLKSAVEEWLGEVSAQSTSRLSRTCCPATGVAELGFRKETSAGGSHGGKGQFLKTDWALPTVEDLVPRFLLFLSVPFIPEKLTYSGLREPVCYTQSRTYRVF